MALHGPASVLDHRRSNPDSAHIVRDRLTRHRSPARSDSSRKYSAEDDDDIDLRIPQPYRTSFSAVAAPIRGKRDRSRSTSPCTSSLKGSNRTRSKSPRTRRAHKHVTYDEKVVIRDSDTSDSVTNLSDRDMDNTSGHFSANSSMMSSESSPRDYSTELRELSQQIVQEYSCLNDSEKNSPDQSSRNKHHGNNVSTPNGTAIQDVGCKSRKYNREPGKLQGSSDRTKKIVVEEDYDHDRSISYRVAIQNNYADEIKQQADEIVSDEVVKYESRPVETTPSQTRPVQSKPPKSPSNDEVSTPRRERRDSSPVEHDPAIAGSRLSRQKRSISASIGNFFRRLSPHLGRRNKKGNISNASSQSLSPSHDDGSFQRHGSTSSLSRGRLRRSLMKLVGKSPKKHGKSESQSSVEDMSRSRDDSLSPNGTDSRQSQAPKSALYMKSIEQSSKADKDIYHKFKERQGSSPSAADAGRPLAIKVAPSKEPSSPERSASAEPWHDERAQPPDSLDVRLVPKNIKSLQASQVSTLSVDGSIGDCSIDQYLTGSEPSLLSETSKQVAVSQSSGDNVSSSNSPTSEQITAQTVSPVHSQHGRQSDLNLFSSDKYIHDSEFFPNDTSPRTPSYLRISSIVNGYGPYIKYTAYKGIERRSPFSSTLSLRSSRSDLTTPVSPAEMPIGKIPNVQAPTNYPPVKNEILSPKLKSPNGLPCEGDAVDSGSVTPVINGANCELSRVNGNHVASDGENGIAVNGQNGHNIGLVENFVSTGDPQQDTEYFLSLTQREEARLLMLCSRCEMELCADTISEEVSGKIRAAVGKANLLINQKFKQFQELCHQHTHPDPEGKPTKWEDLQGFWEMVKIQVDDVDLAFTEIDMMRQNGWQEIKIPSRRSSSSSRSSPKSSSLNVSNTSTPSHTPGSKRRANRMKDTPESSPERSLKAKMAAKERDDARKKMLAEKRAAMKQQRQQEDGEGVEIYVPDDSSKSASPARSTGSDV